MQQEVAGERTGEARIPTTFGDYVKGVGPGIVIAVAWLGTGDLIDSSVSGANYGYALMWVLAIALLSRFFVVSALAKYQLCNSQGDETILDGYARVWRGFPLLLAVCAMMLGFVYASYLLRGAGTALYNLFGRVGGEQYGIFLWSVLVVGLSIFLVTRKNHYKGLEVVAQIAVVTLILAFFIGVLSSGVDVVALVRGLSFGLPPDTGVLGSLIVTVSLIGAVGGSAANLIYPYLIRDKGWRGPRYRKLQIWDLFVGVASLIVINLAVWVVAAETMDGVGLTVESEDDLARMMELAIGSVGPTLLWIALFFVTFDNLPAYSYGFTRMLVDAVHKTFPERAAKYRDVTLDGAPNGAPEAGDTALVESSEGKVSKKELSKSDTAMSDPLFRWVQIGVLIVLPLVFALPFAPNLVILTIAGNAFAVLTAPIIIVGLLFITNNRRWMLQGYANRWWENVILFVVGGIGLWATYGLIKSTLDVLGVGG